MTKYLGTTFNDEQERCIVRRLLGLILACLTLALVGGDGKADGVVNSDGYSYSGNYYWSNGVAYTRELAYYWVDGYYKRSACNCYNVYVPGYWQGYYKYVRAVLKGEDAVVQALTDRMRTQNLMAKEQQRHANLLELVKVAGLEGNFRFEGYFGGRAYPPVGLAYPPAATTHGFTFQQYHEQFGSNLLRNIPFDLLGQQAARQSDNSRSATEQLYSLLGTAAQEDGRVREVLARMEAAKQVFRATEPAPSSKTETKIEGTGPQPQILPQAQVREFVKLSGPAKCVGCHSGADPKGGFDVTKIPTMSAEEIVLKVIPQLIARDGKPAKMPKDGPPLTAQEVRQFLGGQ